MTEYTVTKGSANDYGAPAPDLSGCVSTVKTAEEVKLNFVMTIEMRFEVPREHGETIPSLTA
jgi:predicted RNase H-like HicB family nuclease